jgi:glucokinase
MNWKNWTFKSKKKKRGKQENETRNSWEALNNFLNEFKGTEFWPQVAVLGVAGPVDNNTVEFTNVSQWSLIDGTSLSQILDIPHF